MPKIPLDRTKLRHQTAVLMRNKGYSLQEIGDTIGLTRERVRQILEKRGIDIKTKRVYNGNIKKVGKPSN